MNTQKLCAALVVLGAAFVSPAALSATEAERKLSPKALYQALAKIPRGTTVLPRGYQSPTIGPVAPSPIATRHRAVGAVAIGVSKRGTAGARILFIVFPTRAHAIADWKEATPRLPGKRVTPPGFLPRPSAMVHARATARNASGKAISFGTTVLAFVTENVLVEVDTSSISRTAGGDDAGAIALAQFAGGHLASAAALVLKIKPKPAKPSLPVI